MERKISFLMTDENERKMKEVTADTGITQTDYINAACAGVPILCLKNSEGLADLFANMLSLVGTDNDCALRERRWRKFVSA